MKINHERRNKEKNEFQKSYCFYHSKELGGMVLEIQDIEGMFPLFVTVPKVPSVGRRTIILTNKKRGLLMV